ncbi:MAG: lipopolysaccharide biosynthesis protein [Deltaproteobacteria bacterium]|nr:lipopolysaccharide biosynthesis protein [Deltaproteobacteria bacterium]MCB9787488.1 lipopolysaccharide biosynthesis protein [Deltaproteobacteria bacterium]
MSEAPFARRVARSFLVAGAGNLFAKGLQAVGLFIVLDVITPAQLGTASLVIAIFGMLQAVTELGLGVALVQAKDPTRDQMDTLFWLGFALSGAIYLAVFLAAPLVASFYDQPILTPLLRVQGLAIVLSSLFLIPRNLLVRDLAFGRIALIDNVALTAASAAMVAFAFAGLGPWAIIAGDAGQRVGQLLLTQVARPWWPRLRAFPDAVRGMVRFGLYATGSRLLYNLYTNADYLVVGRIFGADAVGIYTIAYRVVADPINAVASIINQVAYPAFARLQDDTARMRRYYFTIVRANLAFIGPLVLVICVFIDDGFVLVGYDQWLPAVPLVRILGVFGLVRAVSALTGQLLNAVGKARLNFVYSGLNALILPAGFVVGSAFGLEGVAWVWGICYPVLVLFQFGYAARALGVSLLRYTLGTFAGYPAPLAAGVVILATRYVLETTLSLPPGWVAGIGVPVGLLAGAAVALYTERASLALIRS